MKVPDPTVLCCDICNPEHLNTAAPSRNSRKRGPKFGVVDNELKKVIIKWRKEISSRDFGDSLFGPAAVLPNAAVEWIPFVIWPHRMILNWHLTLRKSDDSAPSGVQGQMISLATPLLRHNGLPLLKSQPGPRYEYGYRGKKVRLQEKLDVFFLKLVVCKYGEKSQLHKLWRARDRDDVVDGQLGAAVLSSTGVEMWCCTQRLCSPWGRRGFRCSPSLR